MPTYTVRQGGVDLAFTGVCLVDMSSRKDDSDYWTEIRIYRTDKGKYVAESVGRSARGEPDRRNVAVVDDPAQVREALKRRRRAQGEASASPSYLTDFARTALVAAAKVDPALEAALVETI